MDTDVHPYKIRDGQRIVKQPRSRSSMIIIGAGRTIVLRFRWQRSINLSHMSTEGVSCFLGSFRSYYIQLAGTFLDDSKSLPRRLRSGRHVEYRQDSPPPGPRSG